MTSITQAPISTAAKVLTVLLTIVGVIHLIDFIFYGQALRNVIAGIACALMAYGTYKNGLGKEVRDQQARYASLIGGALFVVYLAIRVLA
ncbi:hypothetical protein [Stenotrophomonas sp. SY1]|jgi:hypothetical protein|uniref:hypothetical protein n=1 Tax=Stenotrophomonas sp. SY1 TaxID=477235 RepID=UPI001E624674|nr:hypothetical protein [Stenotrophomonas sp. SY1]MCD9088637.1 hypothetical protein [Stenotrophomonas sp. SY1]